MNKMEAACVRIFERAQHQVSTVAQLLVLLDGIEERGQVFLLATTNRPEHVDAALRRPGRFDQVVWMGLPDERGRAEIFEHYLRGLKRTCCWLVRKRPSCR